MSADGENTKRLVAFKKRIEARIQDLEIELKDLQATLECVSSLLLEKGFKRAELPAESSSTGQVAQEKNQESDIVKHEAPHGHSESEGAGILRSANGENLADFFVEGNCFRVVPARDKEYNVNTPPFTQFLLQRILLKMQERDNELARVGQLAPDEILCFEVVRDGDLVREIIIRNVDSERLKELRSSIRWTLDKMIEKAKN